MGSYWKITKNVRAKKAIEKIIHFSFKTFEVSVINFVFFQLLRCYNL